MFILVTFTDNFVGSFFFITFYFCVRVEDVIEDLILLKHALPGLKLFLATESALKTIKNFTSPKISPRS